MNDKMVMSTEGPEQPVVVRHCRLILSVCVVLLCMGIVIKFLAFIVL